MGKLLTKIYSHGIREFKLYNIEQRAEKVISKEKPVVAPKYPSTVKELERLKEENVSKEYLYQKDSQLDDNLKKVYVTTPNPLPKKIEINPDRPLPLNRSTDSESVVYGYSESEEKTVPMGQLSLKQALQLIADHKSDPKIFSNTAIAAQYKLPITVTDDILEHFKMFNVHWRKNEKDSLLEDSSYKRLQERVAEMNLVNVSTIVKEFPQFKKRNIFKKTSDIQEVREKGEIKIDVDKNDSGLLNDDKKKR